MALIDKSMMQFAQHMKRHAETGHYTGIIETTALPYFDKARRLHVPTGTSLIFTRDIGHHSSGWFKNPDYEQCYHLSLSFWDLEKHEMVAFDHKLAEAWVRTFYGDWTRYVWEEGPSDEGKLLGGKEIRHYRVFCDPVWQPIVPRGEVYTKDFTDKGWKSFSEKQYQNKSK